MKRILFASTFAVTALMFIFAIFNLNPLQVPGLLGMESGVPVAFLKSSPQQEPQSDKVVLGGSYKLDENEILDGNLLVLGGTAQLQPGSSVTGDVMVLGGTLVVKGQITGDLSILGGSASLEAGAHIFGDVNSLSATLQRDDAAKVDGDFNQITRESWPSILPENLHIPGWQGAPSIVVPGGQPGSNFSSPVRTGWDFLWLLVRSLAWAAIAVLTALFGAKRVSTASDTVIEKPIISLGMGCLTIFIGTAVMLLLIITICGIPFSLLGGFLLFLGWGFGVIAIGTEVGIRLARMFKADWAIPVSAGAGTLLLTLVVNAVELLIPCIGWLLPAGIGLIGLGAAVLTRFGSRPYPEEAVAFADAQLAKNVQIPPPSPEYISKIDMPPNQENDSSDPMI